MSLAEFVKTISAGDYVLIILLVLSVIQITPIKINPWSYLARHIGRAINGEVMAEMKTIQNDLSDVHTEIDKMQKNGEKKEADDARNRILRFDDELRIHQKHSREFFDQILDDVDFYEKFCDTHEHYKNSKADSAIKNIRKVYDIVKETNDFI